MDNITNRKKIENLLLQEMDSAVEQNGDKVTKILVDLFKTMMLERYKVAFQEEIKQGLVHKENLDKFVDFCFSEASVAYRKMPISGLSEEDKDDEINKVKNMLGTIKIIVRKEIENSGVIVIR